MDPLSKPNKVQKLPDITWYSNDASYCLLPSEIRNIRWLVSEKKNKNQNLQLASTTLIPRLPFIQDVPLYSDDAITLNNHTKYPKLLILYDDDSCWLESLCIVCFLTSYMVTRLKLKPLQLNMKFPNQGRK